jgi:hypothetical protein
LGLEQLKLIQQKDFVMAAVLASSLWTLDAILSLRRWDDWQTNSTVVRYLRRPVWLTSEKNALDSKAHAFRLAVVMFQRTRFGRKGNHRCFSYRLQTVGFRLTDCATTDVPLLNRTRSSLRNFSTRLAINCWARPNFRINVRLGGQMSGLV